MTQRILFISLSCVGDAVMTTSVLVALHEKFPDAQIDIVADKRSSALFLECPYRGQIIHKNKGAAFRGAVDLLRRLRATKYDLIVDLRTDGLAYLFRAKKRLTKWHGKPYGPHSVQQFLGVIRELQQDDPLPEPQIWLNEQQEKHAQSLLAGLSGGKLLALGPACGGKEAEKAWPSDHYVSLANALKEQFSSVLLLGGPADAELSSRICEGLSIPFLDTTGKTDLLEAAALVKQCHFFLGSDSGLGHVAAAVGTPTLSLFSNADPERYAPWGKRSAWIRDPEKDARNISVNEVLDKIRNLMRD